MSVEVSRADDADLDAWDDRLASSPDGTVFHQLPFLRVLAEHTGATLHPLVGFKGQEPVGLFPVFELTKGPVSTAFSPPPSIGIPYLGPVLLNYEKLKQRKFERLNRRFVGGVLDWLDDHVGPKYTRVVSGVGYADSRPFQWNEFDVSPRFTYEIDLTLGRDGLLEALSSDARGSIRNGDEASYDISNGGRDAVDYVVGRINSRYDEGDGGLRLPESFVTDLIERLPDGQLRVYEATVDGRRVSGRLTLHYGDTVTLWQGSPKPDHDLDVAINDLINWRSMVDGIEAGKTRCDFIGANTPRLCRYKSKYNPTTRNYYEMESGTQVMTAVSSLYRRFG
jgi:hypothetical protein